MPIINHDQWNISQKGHKDVERHRQKIDKAIRGSVEDIVAEESIITKKREGTVRVSVRGMRDYRFIHSNNNRNMGGVGTGKSNPGDIIARKSKRNTSKPGDQKGEDYMEVEIDIDYLLRIMFDDLELPFIEQKNKVIKLVTTNYKTEFIAKTGKYSLIHKKMTLVETIKRTMCDIHEIINTTKCDENDAHRAYIQSDYDIKKAIQIILDGQIDKTICPDILPNIEDDDIRFRQIHKEEEPISNAVIFFMCDTSGSMDTKKKYIARSLAFWMYEFIKSKYNYVYVRFIVHTTEAKLVNEDEFFKRGESGGTLCHTAFDLLEHLIDTEYPISEYNIYIQYFSDGEDFNPDATVNSIKRLLNRGINLIGYAEIVLQNSGWSSPELLGKMIKQFGMKEKNNGIKFYRSDWRIMAGIIENKTKIYPYLKNLFKVDK